MAEAVAVEASASLLDDLEMNSLGDVVALGSMNSSRFIGSEVGKALLAAEDCRNCAIPLGELEAGLAPNLGRH